MRDGFDNSPLNEIPPVVWALLIPVVAVEVVVAAGASGFVGGPGAVGWRLDALQRFAFSPEILKYMLETGAWPAEHVMRFVTYLFVHGSTTHAVFASVFVLALGKFVGEVFRAWAVVAVFFTSAIVGALAYSAIPDLRVPLFGAYPAVYGLIGAFTFILWARLGAEHANRYRAFTLIGFLMGIKLVFGLLFGGGLDWVADLAGFVAGFALSFVVSPGGWTAVVARLRQR
ncbi:rhomboid family intramembrane serine protease [Ostreiculturibacter nitratireducens]|uniref:rhomboid family intramembrane serine protease n=1 Tax=Ostreiculturibacter nitratireducens TaxID=3075226 RepID=UPI0031B5F48D